MEVRRWQSQVTSAERHILVEDDNRLWRGSHRFWGQTLEPFIHKSVPSPLLIFDSMPNSCMFDIDKQGPVRPLENNRSILVLIGSGFTEGLRGRQPLSPS